MTNNKTDLIPIGKVKGAHGIRGVIRVWPYTESLSFFEPGSSFLMRNAEGVEKRCEIEWAKPYKKGSALFSLKGTEGREMADALAGFEFFIEKSELPELEEGTYYWTDLIGLSVFTTNGECIGCIESVIPTGSNDVYVVKDKDNELLIPAMESVVIEIDLSNKTMRVDLPEGL
ncbi:MAG: 16S rRNA processing protein RimM [Desulfobacterales bacterium]|nr:16S rRNA processing protein RimM [Desulfobacterales bacterium]